MLEIDVVLEEDFDESSSKFGVAKSSKVCLEHSLFTMSKWESLWEIAFLGKKEKTPEQMLSYVELMIVGDNPPPEVFQKLIENHLEAVQKYIDAEMSATKFPSNSNAPASREVHTSELIYYWMFKLAIPIETQHWHLNRLLTLIKVFNLKDSPTKKMSAKERHDLNRARLAQGRTRG